MADSENSSTVYLANGQKAHVVSKVGDEHLVRAIWTTEDEFQDEWPGGPLELVARIFDKPPVAAYDDRILERLRQLKKVSGELTEVRVELRKAKRERERLLSRLHEVEALRYIERFVDGEVTHFAVRDYAEFKVAAMDDYEVEDGGKYYYRDRDYQVVTLVSRPGGRDGRRLAWVKSDALESDRDLAPCLSEDEARELAAARTADCLVEEWGRETINSYRLGEAVKSADLFDVPVSDEIREHLKGRAVESASREVAVAEEQLLVARRKLATAKV